MAGRGIRDIAGTPRDGAISLAAVTAVGAALALLGPFGTFLNGGLGVRLAYWIGLLWISMLFYLPSLWAGVRFSARFDLPPWFGLASTIALASVPMAAVARFAARRVWTHFVAGMSVLDWYGETLIVALPLCFAFAAVKGLLRPERFAEPQAPSLSAEAFGRAQTLLAALGGEANVLGVETRSSRLRLAVKDAAVIDADLLKRVGVRAIAPISPGCLHLVIGPDAQADGAALAAILPR